MAIDDNTSFACVLPQISFKAVGMSSVKKGKESYLLLLHWILQYGSSCESVEYSQVTFISNHLQLIASEGLDYSKFEQLTHLEDL